MIGLLVAAGVVEYVANPPVDPGPPLYASVTLALDTIPTSVEGRPPETIGVTIDWSNGRDAVLTDVVVILRPMKDAWVLGADVEDTPDGLSFRVGDIGPWASGHFTFELYFTSSGSRVVQVTARANELEPYRSSAQTVNVVQARP